MTLAEKLKNLMRQDGITTRSLGARVGVTSAAVTGWCNGASPRPAVTAKLAEFFGVSVDDLLDDTRELTPAVRPAKQGRYQESRRFNEKFLQLLRFFRYTPADVAGALRLDIQEVEAWLQGAVPDQTTAVRLGEFFDQLDFVYLLDDSRELPASILDRGLQLKRGAGYGGRRVIASDPSFAAGARQQSPLPAQLASLGAELSALSAKIYTGEAPSNLQAQLRAHGDKLHRLANQPLNQ